MITTRRDAPAWIALLALAGMVGCSDAGSNAVTGPTPSLAAVNDQRASTFTTNDIFPFGFAATECGNETVVVSGNVHVVAHGTVSSSGSVHAVFHVNPQNIRGFGLTTGAEYMGTGMLQSVENTNGAAPVTSTFVNSFELIGLGAAPDFMLHHSMHLTINATGEVTAAFDHFTTECK